jgi:hypothetical protein
VAAWVPESFWQSFFLTDHPTMSAVWGPSSARWAVRPMQHKRGTTMATRMATTFHEIFIE